MKVNLYSLRVRGGTPEEITAIQCAVDTSIHVGYFTEPFGETYSLDLQVLLTDYHDLQKELEYERKARQIAEEALVKISLVWQGRTVVAL